MKIFKKSSCNGKTLNNYHKRLKDLYSGKLVANRQNSTNVVHYLKSNFSLNEITKLDGKYSKEISIFEINCLNSVYNVDSKYSTSNLNIVTFEIINDEKSSLYYNTMHQDQNIIVILEKSTEYIFSNNTILNNELLLFQGVEQSDIDLDSHRLILYLRLMEESK